MAHRTVKQSTSQPTASLYQELRQQIISMEIKPGADLDEKSLVEKFGVSRTPVREALIRLSAEGLVEIRRNRGATVSVLDLQTLRSIFEAGELIERAYTRLACLRRTSQDIERMTQLVEEFEGDMARKDVAAMVYSNTRLHLLIAQASRNKYFVDCYRRILADHERIAQLWYSRNFEFDDAKTNAKVCQQHRQLLQAIKDRNIDRAEKITLGHASLCKDGLRELLDGESEALADLRIEDAEQPALSFADKR